MKNLTWPDSYVPLWHNFILFSALLSIFQPRWLPLFIYFRVCVRVCLTTWKLFSSLWAWGLLFSLPDTSLLFYYVSCLKLQVSAQMSQAQRAISLPLYLNHIPITPYHVTNYLLIIKIVLFVYLLTCFVVNLLRGSKFLESREYVVIMMFRLPEPTEVQAQYLFLELTNETIAILFTNLYLVLSFCDLISSLPY